MATKHTIIEAQKTISKDKSKRNKEIKGTTQGRWQYKKEKRKREGKKMLQKIMG